MREKQWHTNGASTTISPRFYVCKFGPGRIASSNRELVERLGIPAGSFNVRVGNFKALLGKGGLYNYSQQSEGVYRANKDRSEAGLRELALKGFASGARD